ncbi:MAG: hypothetical protein ATN36_04440 [Epulopiscium sp. Nele67-Bin005]|nr:MAG: hypothetical protein ATN36_04440 [Epulopiscium sp. Nele67-Bin005]
MEKFNNFKLAKKLTLLMALITSIILMILVTSTTVGVGYSNSILIMDKFKAQAELNANIVQNMLDGAFNVATNLQAYIDSNFYKFGAPIYDEEGNVLSTSTSNVYGVPLAAANSRAEDFILNTIWAAILDNPHIGAVGVLFDPYKFDPTQEIFSFWVTPNKANQQSMIPLTEYSQYSTADFYTSVKQTKSPVITTPLLNADNVYTSFIAYPIVYQNEFQGVICIELLATNFDYIAVENPLYPSLHCAILTDDWEIYYDSESLTHIGMYADDFITQESMDKWNALAIKREFFIVETQYPNGSRHVRFISPIEAGDELWWSHLEISTSDFLSEVVSLVAKIIFISVVALILLIVIMTRAISKQLKPIDKVVEASSQIAEGNLNITIVTPYNDEIGILATGFSGMASHLKTIITEIEVVLGKMADGDFTAASNSKLLANYNGQFAPIKKSMRTIGKKLSSSLENITRIASEVNHGAADISVAANDLAHGSVSQSLSIDTFITTTTNMGQSILNSQSKVENAKQISQNAKEKASKGEQSMKEMLTSMEQINSSSKTISMVLGKIEEIADQTNLLALNASIEAARAGESGKGFAVVASEVRDLSLRTTNIIKDVKEIIQESTRNVDEGQKIANQTAHSLHEIVEAVEVTAKISNELSQISTSQQQSIQKLLDESSEITAVVEVTTATSEESAAISNQLAGNAHALEELLQHFKFRKDL